jgi:DNA-binding winged helix-turn-helix (wHTH) protein
MKKTFVINHSVRFDPRSRTLVLLERPEKAVVLHTPASECLLLLLTHNGETLSHSFLSEEVWIKKGNYVTTNSLYQNISAIRRGLKSVGLADDLLKTVPKSGFQIYASIEEETLPPEQEVSPEDISVVSPDEKRQISNDAEINQSLAGKKIFKASLNTPIKIYGLILIIIFIAGSIFLYKELRLNSNFFNTYGHVGMIGQCDVYSSYSGKNKSIEVFNFLMKPSTFTCQKGDKAWLTFNADPRLASVVLCDQSINNPQANCKSFLFSGDINEKH